MSGLLYLDVRDFNLKKDPKGDLLCNKIKGFSLILFYSTKCEYCEELIPIFKKLPGSIEGCLFGMINVSFKENTELVKIATETRTPIQYVPLIIFYNNGVPFMRYDADYKEEQIKKFVIVVGNEIRNRQKFINQPPPSQQQQQQQYTSKKISSDDKGMLIYVGKPLYGMEKRVCYLEFNKAYLNVTKR